MDYYSIIKRKELLIHATIWVNRSDIRSSEKKSGTNEYIFYESSYMKFGMIQK